MLGAVRRNGVAQALRASGPRALYSKSIPQMLTWQRPSGTVFPAIVRSLHNSVPRSNGPASATAQAADPAEPVSEEAPLTQFADLAKRDLVHRRIITNIVGPMNIKTMTPVQSMTLSEILKGDDVLAQAKTGTGKTLAFLVPVLQNVMKDPTMHRLGRSPSKPSDIRAIIISPTRELAEQIAVEARKVAYGTGISVQTAVGGTRKREGLLRIRRNGCHVLVGTPGRLKDILSDPMSGVTAPNMTTFVLDEADRLLDQGFAPDIKAISDLLPDPMKVDRQTLMFSATVPREVMTMVRQTMKPDFKFVKTVRDDEVPTHLTVPQKTVWLNGFENALPAVFEIAKNYSSQQAQNPESRPFKAIVYFNTTAETQLAYKTFSELTKDPNDRRSGHPLGRSMRFYEIHSRLTQAVRSRNADDFRKARTAILFSSDVTARGMDFPDVTHVIQVHVPSNRETYIHRLGRTARANKTGEGWLLLHSGQSRPYRSKIGDLPLQEDHTSLHTPKVDLTADATQEEMSPVAAEIISHFKEAMAVVDEDLKRRAYLGMVGSLLGQFPTTTMMLSLLNNLAIHGMGLSEPPRISRELAARLNIDKEINYDGRSRSDSRYSQRGSWGSQDRRGSSRPSSRYSDNDRGYGSRRNSGSSWERRGSLRNTRGPMERRSVW